MRFLRHVDEFSIPDKYVLRYVTILEAYEATCNVNKKTGSHKKKWYERGR
jgi:hypothetical protein